MSAIIDFFSGIADFFSSIVDFVVGFFEDLVYVIQLLGAFVAQIPQYFFFLPPAVVALLVTAFGIVLIYMILGRNG